MSFFLFCSQVHQMPLQQLREKFIRGYVKKWGMDQYSLGAFVFAHPHHVLPEQERL